MILQRKGNAEQETGGRGCSEHITAEECEDVTGSHLLQIQDYERNERLTRPRCKYPDIGAKKSIPCPAGFTVPTLLGGSVCIKNSACVS